MSKQCSYILHVDDVEPLLVHGIKWRTHTERRHDQAGYHGREEDKANQETAAEALHERNG